jgi:hypothetical protein
MSKKWGEGEVDEFGDRCEKADKHDKGLIYWIGLTYG